MSGEFKQNVVHWRRTYRETLLVSCLGNPKNSMKKKNQHYARNVYIHPFEMGPTAETSMQLWSKNLFNQESKNKKDVTSFAVKRCKLEV